MQFAQFPHLASSHFPLVGKGTTDETFTTSENISINVDEIFVSLYIITLSMFLSINVSMYLSLANEREIMETLPIPSYNKIKDTSYVIFNKTRHM